MSIKKSIYFLIVLTAITCAQAFTAGNGTPENPYQISTRADLEAVNNNLAANYILINDVDLSGTTYTRAVIAYNTNIDVGFRGKKFTGSFNGNGFIISDLAVNGASYCGLFGYCDTGVEINNLAIENANIIGDGYYVATLIGFNLGSIYNGYSTGVVTGGSCIGSLVGYNKNGIITSCYSTGVVTGDYDIGGLVGFNENGSITGCYSTGAVIGDYSYAGGLVGDNYGSITNSYSTGTVTGDESIGGLVGLNENGSIVNSYSTSAVTGNVSVGGLVGLNNLGSILNSYSNGKVIGESFIGGLVSRNSGIITGCYWDKETSSQFISAGGEPKTTVQMKESLTFMGWNDGNWTINSGNDYPRLNWESVVGEPIKTVYEDAIYSGSGTENDPFVLSSSSDLVCMSKRMPDWSGYFILTSNIDMAGVVYVPVVEFSGNFQGNGFVISNLTIDSEIIGCSFQLGLFGTITGKVGNLALEKVKVVGSGLLGGLAGTNEEGSIAGCYSTGAISGEFTVGGLVGYNNYGSITDCYSTGVVNGGSSTGGLCGSNYGTISNCYSITVVNGSSSTGGLCGRNSYGTITSCYATGEVTGDNHVGGLCGSNYEDTITSCYAKGKITGRDGVGGLCGYNYYNGTITSCYATGEVMGGNNVGGLCGHNDDAITSSYATGVVTGDSNIGGLCGRNNYGTITSSYATGEVSGSDNSDSVGGLCGGNSGTITSSFWDTHTSGQVTSAGGMSKTTIQMKVQATFTDAGWDFVGEKTNGIHEFWYMGASGYPDLYVFSESYLKHTFEGLGNSQSPYHIYDKYDLVAINQNTAANYILMNDINLSGEIYTQAIISSDFVSSTDSFNGTKFTGSFNGNGFKIQNLTINGSSNDYIALFGSIGFGGSVENLSVVDCDISGNNYVGGLCGYSNEGTITSCYATGEVTGINHVGGLCGVTDYGTITSCYATGEVTGISHVGGLCGEKFYGTISSSFWDIETSGQATSDGGTGKTTAQMKDINTFLDAEWKFSGFSADWFMPEDGYPVLGGFAGQPMRIDIVSMAMLADCWLQTDLVLDDPNNLCYQIDLNGDSTINDDDLLAITNNWLGYHFWENMVDFDDSDFNDDDSWTYGGMDEWLIVDGEGANGSVCFKSDDVSYGQDTNLDWVVDTTGFNTIGFDFKFDAWSNCVLTFYIDGVAAYSHSGAVDWTYITLPIPAAEHTLTWTFTRGFAFSYGENAAYLDNVILFNK